MAGDKSSKPNLPDPDDYWPFLTTSMNTNGSFQNLWKGMRYSQTPTLKKKRSEPRKRPAAPSLRSTRGA